ncbi:MAG TPA: glycosyltransferase family 4 protein, partial [Thermodesulfobacteriota bacterium]|nr:glycosyltransferase family 4 protein [Thermodesulfobacteriota bacterium]
MVTIVHVIERFSTGGPERALIAAAKYAMRLNLKQQHIVCPLEQGSVSPPALLSAMQAGVIVRRRHDAGTFRKELESADIVLVHFWNNPSLDQFLRSDLPPMRLLIWTAVNGLNPPQVITTELIDFADRVLVKTPKTLTLPACWKAPVSLATLLYSPIDLDRLENFSPVAHNTFNIGYIGTVNFTKMHPYFIRMSAAVRVPNVRLIVCGTGIEKQLKNQATALGASGRFDFRGYVENIRSVLAELDVFGYPLCEDTYAASERALQEAMFVGLPPVIFPHGGLSEIVTHGQTGLIVQSEEEYRQAIEYLYQNPQERQRLGENARHHAQQTFDPWTTVKHLSRVFEEMMQFPKKKRVWHKSGTRPAEWFIQALGDKGGHFAISLTGEKWPELMAAEQVIAQASPVLCSGEGGIIHYRNYYP